MNKLKFLLVPLLIICLSSCKKEFVEVVPKVYVGEGSMINNDVFNKTIQFDSMNSNSCDFFVKIEKGNKDITKVELVLGNSPIFNTYIINDYTNDTTLIYNNEVPYDESKNSYHLLIKTTGKGTYKNTIRALTGGNPGKAVVNIIFN